MVSEEVISRVGGSLSNGSPMVFIGEGSEVCDGLFGVSIGY